MRTIEFYILRQVPQSDVSGGSGQARAIPV